MCHVKIHNPSFLLLCINLQRTMTAKMFPLNVNVLQYNICAKLEGKFILLHMTLFSIERSVNATLFPR